MGLGKSHFRDAGYEQDMTLNMRHVVGKFIHPNEY